MVLGYFGYASLWLGKGLAAAASIPGNLVQGVFGIAAGVAVYAVLDRSHVLARAGCWIALRPCSWYPVEET